MSEQIKVRLSVISLVAGIVASAAAFFQAYAVLPYRVDKLEEIVEKRAVSSGQDREMLIRIEERVMEIQQKLNIR